MNVRRLADDQATRELGRELAATVSPGSVIALSGPLGAGKTTLTQGLAEGLGIVGPVPSPTFVLMRDYVGRLRLVHVDAYRLAGEDEALAIGLDEHLPGDGVTVIEWPERIAELLPPETVWITLAPDGAGRRATIGTAPEDDG